MVLPPKCNLFKMPAPTRDFKISTGNLVFKNMKETKTVEVKSVAIIGAGAAGKSDPR